MFAFLWLERVSLTSSRSALLCHKAQRSPQQRSFQPQEREHTFAVVFLHNLGLFWNVLDDFSGYF